MILTKKIKISRKGCPILDFYKQLGYNINEDFFEIELHHLSQGSKKSITLLCDSCGCIKNMNYKDYNRFNTFPYYNCNDCKRRKTNLEKWGVEYTSKLEHVKRKKEKTNLEKYGNKISSKNKDVILKIKNTNLEKYGVENVFELDFIKEKSQITNLEKYGNKIYSKTNEYLEKVKKTNNFLYGKDFYPQTSEYKDKLKKIIKSKYGSSILYYHSIQNKIVETNLVKYNASHYLKNETKRKYFKITNNPNYIKYLDKSVSLFKCDLDKNHFFEISYINYSNRLNSKIPLCTICNPIGKLSSIKEKELYEFIKEIYDGDIIKSYRDSLEIDVYLPKLNIGFEFNGIYWHSELFKNKKYHLNKTNFFKDKGIEIIHIWENDWDLKKNIIKSIIIKKVKLLDNKIDINDCLVKEIAKKDHINFLYQNSLLELKKSSVYIGIFYEDSLLFTASFLILNNSCYLNSFCESLDMDISNGLVRTVEFLLKSYLPKKLYISIANEIYSEKILEGLSYNLHKVESNYKTVNGYKIYDSGKSIYKINI